MGSSDTRTGPLQRYLKENANNERTSAIAVPVGEGILKRQEEIKVRGAIHKFSPPL
jgi:hypothetical protein